MFNESRTYSIFRGRLRRVSPLRPNREKGEFSGTAASAVAISIKHPAAARAPTIRGCQRLVNSSAGAACGLGLKLPGKTCRVTLGEPVGQ
jgi:hypothetical protein